MRTRVVAGVVIVLLAMAAAGVWKWQSGLTPHYEKATVCGIRSALVEDLFGTDRFVESYGFGRRCSAVIGGPGSENGEVEFMLHTDDESSWPRRLRTVESSPHRISFNGGRGGYGRVDDSLEGTWMCSRYWPGLSAISVWASSEVDGSEQAFGKVLRAAVEYAAGCDADPLDGPFEAWADPTACGMSTTRVVSVLGTKLLRGADPDPLPLGDQMSWVCSLVTDSVDGDVGSIVAAVSVEQNDWEDEHRRIRAAEDSFALAGGQAYVDAGGPAGRAFWACDLGPEVAGGGVVVSIGAAGVSDRPVSGGDLRAMVAEVAGDVGCGVS
ncbi:hypothetical protein [Nocardioides albus]|uniref:DUF3558 domain-containing protein n=1 Tax=Nocardioides albus TaxID=1841 RepID=A0A7W5F8I1_9ACTN|nr:hypothetical protein [Nocardioides albus]MBB3089153.1 hypothetical protein [Nocardioides albus]GGU13907.1 hypothetical protein GCM10007979_10330 [Nocardioides albus]